MNDTTNTTSPYVPLKQQIKARFNALLDEVLDQLIIEPGDPNHWLAVTTSIPKGLAGGAVVDLLGSKGIGGAMVGSAGGTRGVRLSESTLEEVERLWPGAQKAIYEAMGWPLPETPSAESRDTEEALAKVEQALDSLGQACQENEDVTARLRGLVEAYQKNPFRY